MCLLTSEAMAFDLVLSYPQWQGSARHANLQRGAAAAASVCADYGPMVPVPLAGAGEPRGGINGWTAILQQFLAAQHILRDHDPARILAAGGDCACDIAIIDHLRRRHSDLNVIWVDAHLDANTAATSPSGSFHGMPVAVLMGAAPPELAPLLGPPLAADRFRYVAAHVGDAGEWAFQRAHGLTWLDAAQIMPGPVHVHFDLDALDPAAFPHVAYPDGYLAPAAGIELVRALAVSGQLVGLTITEFAPADDDAAMEGSRFLRQLCEAAVGR